MALLPAGTATRIQDHIWFQGVEYTCDGLATGDGAAEPEAPQAVAVRYDPGRMDVLFLVRNGALLRCRPVLDALMGLSWHEWAWQKPESDRRSRGGA